MNHWFTRRDAAIVSTFGKRFDPQHWVVDFPRGTIASNVGTADGHGMVVTAEFLRKGDLVGLIYESEDKRSHPAHARETSRDYSGCKLSFHWQSSGLIGLDAVNGPTLTIEGKDAGGSPQTWYVRLWNYATGTATNADIKIDFDALDGGFMLPTDANRVNPRNIERMFISMAPPDFVAGSTQLRSTPAIASVTLSGIKCEGPGSTLSIKDAVVPQHGLRIATAYDDLYHLPPERIVSAIERLGYRGTINHYIGMSHYMALSGSGLVDAARPFNSAARAWHEGFARSAKARGFEIIWSLSYEILDQFCPDAWKQRAFDQSPALTGYDPPSALVSPASSAGIQFLSDVAADLVGIAAGAQLLPQVQIGEPWWWVTASGGICLYDPAAKAALGGNPVQIADVRGSLSAAQKSLLDSAGALLAASTATIAAAAKAEDPATRTLLLVYLPGVLDPAVPEARRANCPVGWARPAFDRLQLEDYEWVTGGRATVRQDAYAVAASRLGYPLEEQHYFSGFVADAADLADWGSILDAAREAQSRGCAEVFVWALPQVLRDGLTIFGEEHEVTPFDDVSFPIEIGAEASVMPGFSTNIVTSASGYEFRNANWAQSRMRFDAGPGVRGEGELHALLGFFRARRGSAVGFRFKDPFDNSSNGMTGTVTALDQQIGTGDGANCDYALVKHYSIGEVRRITRPVTGSIRVAVNGVEVSTGWTVEGAGIIRFASPPPAGAAIAAGFEFDVPVRFADDRLEINRATFLAGEAPSVPLVEIREA